MIVVTDYLKKTKKKTLFFPGTEIAGQRADVESKRGEKKGGEGGSLKKEMKSTLRGNKK